MTLTDALASALDEWMSAADDEWTNREAADFILADPAFREALTAALAEALDTEEEAVGFTVYEAWPTAVAIVAHLLPAAATTADTAPHE